MKIELTATINQKEIALSGGSTSWINSRNINLIQLNELESNIRLLAKKCKENKVRFSRRRVKNLKEIYPAYLATATHYQGLYNLLAEKTKEIFEQGLYSPVVENESLKVASGIQNEMNQMHWRSSPLSQLHEIEIAVESYLKQDLSGFEMIAI